MVGNGSERKGKKVHNPGKVKDDLWQEGKQVHYPGKVRIYQQQVDRRTPIWAEVAATCRNHCTENIRLGPFCRYIK